MTTAQKMEILKRCWTPPESYNFAKDAEHLKRKFKHSWLQTYSPWLTHSKRLKGALCLYCVMFPPTTVQGVLGSFIIRPFTRYKDLHEHCKNHVSSQWHQTSTKAAKNFMESLPVNVVMISAHKKVIEENRKIVSSIISTIMFCGTHDLPLRGKAQHQGIFEDLIKLKIEAGDQHLTNLEKCKKNATYMSPQIQNEIIVICGAVIKDEVIGNAKKAYAYSILAYESADIAGKEQLSIGVRFFEEEKMAVCEEFVGFVELAAMDAKTIATAIDKFIQNEGLDADKCVGQGYDGCSTMAGKSGGVQKILKEKYKKALFFHCASHKLNLVVNDLNCVPEIRNTIAIVKDIINFFRESVLRRKHAPNIPVFCETRWSQKYKSIAIFKEHFVSIVQGLEKLSRDGNSATRKVAFQLYCAATKPVFIICVGLIAKYSALLEPVANALQSKSLNLLQCSNHIKRIMAVLKDHRETADMVTQDLLAAANVTAQNIAVELTLSRVVERQQQRSNPPASTPAEFWKRSLMIPYLDSLISSLEQRFSDENQPAFSLLSLHPFIMLDMTFEDFRKKIKDFSEFYNLSDFYNEAEMWYSLWKEKKLEREIIKDLDLADVVKEAETFFPATKHALHIALAQPCTTSTIERSFSTLRRVKTWLRTTMTEGRLNGLCLLSVHRQLVFLKKAKLEGEVLKRFAEDPRRLVL